MYEDKSTYNGDWQNGLRHGHGEHVSANENGLRNSRGEYVSVYRGMWVNDKPHGKGVLSITEPERNLLYKYSGESVCNNLQ